MLAVIGVVKVKAEVSPASVNQPAKVDPVRVGAAGSMATVLYATLWLVTALPPLLLKVTV